MDSQLEDDVGFEIVRKREKKQTHKQHANLSTKSNNRSESHRGKRSVNNTNKKKGPVESIPIEGPKPAEQVHQNDTQIKEAQFELTFGSFEDAGDDAKDSNNNERVPTTQTYSSLFPSSDVSVAETPTVEFEMCSKCDYTSQLKLLELYEGGQVNKAIAR